MAEQTQGTITIDAPPAAVMAVLSDYEAYPEWATGMRKAQILEKDDAGRAARVRFEVSMIGISGWYILAYEYAPDDGGLSWSFVEGSPLRDLTGIYELEPRGTGTHVTYRANVDPGVPMIGFMKRKVEQSVIDTALKGLKKRVESLR